jgi:cobalt-zinc-cadmium efflux system membrane fusion protein
MKNTTILILLTLLFSCKPKNENTSQQEENRPTNTIQLTAAQLKAAQIETGSIETKTLSSQIKVNGVVDVPPQNVISVSAPLGGYLHSTHLLPGMEIKKGEVIAVLEDQQYIQLQQDYLTCLSKLQYLDAEYKRQKELNATKTSSDKVLQQTYMEYTNQKINFSALTEKLKLININPANLTENSISKSISIYSPINGFVTKVNVNPGKYITPSDVLFELMNPHDIHLNLKVFEKDLDKLRIGQKLVAYTNNQPNKQYDCEILLVSQDILPDRTADVHCHFEQYDRSLLPGTYMNAIIEADNFKTTCLPESAIVNFEGTHYIFIAESANRFIMTAIETGIAEKGFLEIKYATGLGNKPIVTKGAYTLLMALKNKPE